MAKDFMRYDRMAQDALRGVVRMALERVAKEGLPGAHHFFITFFTDFPGVEISEALHERYPVDMTVVLQHQYWDLEVAEDYFAVSLSFNKVPERLVVPYKSIRAFIDPSVQFGLEFQVEGFSAEPRPRLIPTDGQNADVTTLEQSTLLKKTDDKAAEKVDGAKDADSENKQAPEKTGDVVSLDAFRKK